MIDVTKLDMAQLMKPKAKVESKCVMSYLENINYYIREISSLESEKLNLKKTVRWKDTYGKPLGIALFVASYLIISLFIKGFAIVIAPFVAIFAYGRIKGNLNKPTEAAISRMAEINKQIAELNEAKSVIRLTSEIQTESAIHSIKRYMEEGNNITRSLYEYGKQREASQEVLRQLEKEEEQIRQQQKLQNEMVNRLNKLEKENQVLKEQITEAQKDAQWAELTAAVSMMEK